MMDEREWLDSLKPGDEVFVDGKNSVGLTTVLRRTPTHRIVVKWGNGTMEFNPNGSLRTSNAWDYASLEKPTQEHKDMLEKSDLVHKLRSKNWNKLTLEQLRVIAAILDNKAA